MKINVHGLDQDPFFFQCGANFGSASKLNEFFTKSLSSFHDCCSFTLFFSDPNPSCGTGLWYYRRWFLEWKPSSPCALQRFITAWTYNHIILVYSQFFFGGGGEGVHELLFWALVIKSLLMMAFFPVKL